MNDMTLTSPCWIHKSRRVGGLSNLSKRTGIKILGGSDGIESETEEFVCDEDEDTTFCSRRGRPIAARNNPEKDDELIEEEVVDVELETIFAAVGGGGETSGPKHPLDDVRFILISRAA